MYNGRLVGELWICPNCKTSVLISDIGIDHKCKGYWIKYSFGDFEAIASYEKKQRENLKKFMYG